MRHLLLIVCVAAATAAHAASDVVISQVYGGGGNTGAQYRNDFIELFNRGAAPIDVTGWSVQYSSATAGEWQVTPLAGVLQPGRYLLVQQAAGASGTLDLPRADTTGTIALSATTGKVALVRTAQALTGATPASAGIVDVVGYGPTANFFERASAPQLSNTTAALREGGGCVDTDDNSSDFRTAPPAPRNSETAGRDCTALPPPVPTVLISEVQGAGDRSPLVGQRVTVRGVLTKVKPNGFFIQSVEPDADPATSEGLFVFTGSAGSAPPADSNLVEVTGTVAEFGEPVNTLTELVDPSGLTVLGPADLPPFIHLPPGGLWERYEGMRVFIAELIPVSPAGGVVDERTATARDSGIIYGVFGGVERPYRMSEAEVHREVVRVDNPGASLETVWQIYGIDGPLDVSFGGWSIPPIRHVLGDRAPFRAEPILPPQPAEFTIATMNLQRLFDTADDPRSSDVVLTPGAFETRVTRIARAIREVLQLPDVIGVQEVENLETLRAIATTLGDYRAYLEEGNDPGGIDVGFLVRSRVQVLSVQQFGRTEEFTFGGRTELLWDRPPFILRGRIGTSPTFTVAVNHLRSLLDSDDPRVIAKRTGQARSLAQWIQQRHAPAEPLAVVGDFNSFPAGEPLSFITGITPPLLNLTNTLPPDENYTYIHDGVAQTLDHILINPPMHRWLMRYTVARLNADAAETRRNDASGRERISDHDHPIAYFNPDPPAVRPASVTNSATWQSGAIAPHEVISIFGTGFTAGTNVLFNDVPAAILYRGPGQINALVPADITPGPYATLRVGTSTLTLPLRGSAPGLFRPVLNQDFSTNSPARPAARGSIIMLWGTGAGRAGPVTATVGEMAAEITYAGGAPGMPAGIFQANVRIPGGAPIGDAVPIRLAVQGRGTQRDLTVAVR